MVKLEPRKSLRREIEMALFSPRSYAVNIFSIHFFFLFSSSPYPKKVKYVVKNFARKSSYVKLLFLVSWVEQEEMLLLLNVLVVLIKCGFMK